MAKIVPWLGLLFLVFIFDIFDGIFVRIFHRRLEIPNTFSQAFAEIGELARPEKQKRNGHNQQNVPWRKQTLSP